MAPNSGHRSPGRDQSLSLSHTHTDERAVPNLKQAWVLPHNSLSLAGVAALISALPLVDNGRAVLSLHVCALVSMMKTVPVCSGDSGGLCGKLLYEVLHTRAVIGGSCGHCKEGHLPKVSEAR